ncbi:MAG: IS1595 family transposase [Bacteroidales bacterium]|jgi:transposase-like protein|nr:IS1595 family transposase [Bacteroidales bacterium]
MKIQEILNNLDLSEKKKLYSLLKKDIGLTPQLDSIKSELNKDQKILCPHCHSADIYGHGVYKGRKRYHCKGCKKTFNDFTGTAISGIKKVEKFQEFLELTIKSITIRKAATQLDVNVKTIFDWRHKLLSAVSTMNGTSFSIGIVECDDKQLDINEKGQRHLKRDAYKRPSDRETKRGVSNDKVSLMVATDRKGNPVMRIAKIGRIDVKSIEKTIGELISNSNVLCSDSHPSIISWAKGKDLEHHTFIASKQHVKNKCYHVQHVNSLDNLYERWIKPFYGVATKYLPQYLNWFVFLEKVKKSTNQIDDFARAVMLNANAIKQYREIEDKYLELNPPHYS